MMSPVPSEERDRPAEDNTDSNNVEEDENIPDFFISQSSSDSDGDEASSAEHIGYELLPQEPDSNEAEEIIPGGQIPDQADVSSHLNQMVLQQLQPTTPDFPSLFPTSVPAKDDKTDLLWNQPRHSQDGDTLEQGQADKIREAMVGFQLPTSHVPEWAKDIPEDLLNEQLIMKVQQLRSCSRTDNRKDGFHQREK